LTHWNFLSQRKIWSFMVHSPRAALQMAITSNIFAPPTRSHDVSQVVIGTRETFLHSEKPFSSGGSEGSGFPSRLNEVARRK
jgi:hypothetical protein